MNLSVSKSLRDAYKMNPAKALLAFNEKCEAGLREEVIIVERQKQ